MSDRTDRRDKTFLIISQVYVPDPASVGQHMADAAAEMARRGYRVRVLTSARGYDDPSRKYPARETLDGVEVRRLPLSSFGKRSILMRLLGAVLFLSQATLHALFTPNLKGMLISTSPPMCAMLAIIVGAVRRVPIKYWVMDLNPDQAVSLGKARPGSFAVKAFDWLNRRILGRASDIIVLDRFMKDRVVAKRAGIEGKIEVMPPWPHEQAQESLAHEDNPFRKEHGLDGKFVVMYSGNHGPTNPITTLLRASVRLKDREDIVFLFIGGGIGKKEVEQTIAEHPEANIRSLPYQPMETLRYSLSSADVHVVTVGNEAVGIVHPCKVYGAMAVARPVLLFGPKPCHVSELLDRFGVGWSVEHGDVEGAVDIISRLADGDRGVVMDLGCKARDAIAAELSREQLCGRFCDVLERGVDGARAEPIPA